MAAQNQGNVGVNFTPSIPFDAALYDRYANQFFQRQDNMEEIDRQILRLQKSIKETKNQIKKLNNLPNFKKKKNKSKIEGLNNKVYDVFRRKEQFIHNRDHYISDIYNFVCDHCLIHVSTR